MNAMMTVQQLQIVDFTKDDGSVIFINPLMICAITSSDECVSILLGNEWLNLKSTLDEFMDKVWPKTNE